MNMLLNSMKQASNFTHTENGAITHKTTESALLDMFAMGGAMRQRSAGDVILMFKKAYQENPVYALKCLFYLRDVRGGQGERRFFRECMKWLAKNDKAAAQRNLQYVAEFGRWDDLYCFVGTSLEKDAFKIMKEQFILDLNCKTPSLLAKWLHSENATSKENAKLGALTCQYFGYSPRQYRKHLSTLRERIRVLERLMSQNRWNEIEFDKIPSKAGLKYKNAFARRDIIKAKYEKFAKDENTKVNAEVLNPVDIAGQILGRGYYAENFSEIDRLMFQKYWDNLKDYYGGREERGIAVIDVSGSMRGQPMNAAVSMGAYIAERGKGPFQNHFITFSNSPQLVEFEGVDITDKFLRARRANWGMNTNIEATFNLLLNTARKNKLSQSEMPERIYIFSDMEFDRCTGYHTEQGMNTLLESIAQEWRRYGYELPSLIFWNLNARQENIPAIGNRFSYVSGFSMNMIENILSGKDGYSLMLDKLDSERYSLIS